MPYQHNNHLALYRTINNVKRRYDYSNTVAITQSSGAGKSRMVDEQAKFAFTIPFNLRPECDPEYISRDYYFPPPDVFARRHLADPEGIMDYEDLLAFYCIFFARLFYEVQQEVARSITFNHPHRELAALWREHLEQPGVRGNLYKNAGMDQGESKSIENILKDRAASQVGTDQQPLWYLARREAENQLGLLMDLIPDPEIEFSMGDGLAAEMAREKPAYGRNWESPVKLLFYFDEAQVLAKKDVVPDNEEHATIYDVLLWVFNQLRDYPIFAIFISTNTHAIHFPPPGPLAPSARWRGPDIRLQAPITETPFDCYPSPPIKSGEYSLKHVVRLEFMARFGRPLFWAVLKGAEPHKVDHLESRLVDLARAKLIGKFPVDQSHTNVSRNASLAIIDLRLLLDFMPGGVKTKATERELVANHMRTAFSIPSHYEYMHSGYPSEPILAEAAARQLFSFRSHTDTNPVLEILKRETRSGLLDMDERGEVTARVLLTDAYDRAIERECGRMPEQGCGDRPPHYSAGCKFETFIEELYERDAAQQFLDSQSDNTSGGLTLRKMLKDASVRFTHWTKLGDEAGITTSGMYAAFLKCTAFVSCTSQGTVNAAIPVLLRRSDPICEANMTGILVSIKRGMIARTPAALSISAKKIGFFPKQDTSGRPYVALVMELGVEGWMPLCAPGPSMIPKKKLRSSSSPAAHPRYTFHAYGCSDTVYKGIKLDERDDYMMLLATRSFLDEHARQDPNSLGLVRQMQPFWAQGSECYSWMEDGLLTGGVDGEARWEDRLPEYIEHDAE
ncbi:hypothetical protein BOTBODRAFT_175000 [Botryobasidium botryosum FD-172 SS1]|uniref:Uncharacterized protein n=1 Tax=Botryobasidium botryosum (strain FD-172 SS1) TaxID=930990 RepID=A0A067MEL6_BOTB1|nr:hypothetical protein BOTBODRAFT_175000 [Botryobasidium botryosum FD-172 SS1]